MIGRQVSSIFGATAQDPPERRCHCINIPRGYEDSGTPYARHMEFSKLYGSEDLVPEPDEVLDDDFSELEVFF